MALLTGSGKVRRAVGPVPLPVAHMVDMELCPVLYGTSAELAGVVIPQEHGGTQGIGAVLLPFLVIRPFREGLPGNDRL